MADDRQRIGLLPALRHAGRGRALRRRPGLLDGGRPARPGLGGRTLMRTALAVLAGKATGALSRASGRGGGTTFPGDVARAIHPGVLRSLASDLKGGAVLITGTNGKTTTSRLVSGLLEGLP